jgi:2-methylcitrate dehydratase PrpD
MSSSTGRATRGRVAAGGASLGRAFIERLLEAGQDLPAVAAHETRRALLNVVGTAVGASQTPAVDAVVRTGARQGGRSASVPPGRTEHLDRYWAATATGLAAHLDDFDDTHLETVIHPAAAVLGALWGAAAAGPAAAGGRLLQAAALGMEAQLRVGMAMTPWHYEQGWHITGTCGVLGAAVAASVLRGLDADATLHALGAAASMTLGHRESFGTMVKPLHAGQAAANGLLAADLAGAGILTAPAVLEAPGGYLAALSGQWDASWLAPADVGRRWLLLDNSYKPYPCGVVAHPAIEAAVGLSAALARGGGRSGGRAADVAEIEVVCHPLVPELMGKSEPGSGLEARFSAVHAVAVAVLDGAATLRQFTDERVADPAVAALRRRVVLRPDSRCGRQAATVRARLAGGRVEEVVVEAVASSRERPLTDSQLAQKFTGLVEPVLPGAAAPALEALWALGEGSDLPDVARLVTGVPAASSRRPPAGAGHDATAGAPASGRPPAAASDSLSARVASFAAQLDASSLPPQVRACATRCLAGVLARGVGGSAHPDAARVRAWAAALGTPGEATVLGRTERMSATWSPFVNAVSACRDTMPAAGSARMRLEAAAVCAALAAAEAGGRSAGDLLAGIAAGLETGVRLERGLGDGHVERGWDVAGTAGHVAAAVAAARAGGLPPAGVLVAMGVAATEAAGLRAMLGTPVEALQVAKTAMDGVAAACLAQAGFDGPREPVEGRRGLLALAGAAGDPSVIADGLGETWQFAGAPGQVPAGDAARQPEPEPPSEARTPGLTEDQARELVESAVRAGGSLRSLLRRCCEPSRNRANPGVTQLLRNSGRAFP